MSIAMKPNDLRHPTEVEVNEVFDKAADDDIRERTRMAFDYASAACHVLHQLWEFDRDQDPWVEAGTAVAQPGTVTARRRAFYDKAWASLRAARRAGVDAEDLLAAQLDREVTQ